MDTSVNHDVKVNSVVHHIPPGGEVTNPVATANSAVILNPEEFADDLEHRLGRANGNVYHRKPGVEGVHDGQIMIRLKRKRFIVIDYGIVPSQEDIRLAACSNRMATPPGCGKQKCVNSDCSKVGIPVLLYDSDPTQPASLYMRSGLCFSCQRLLNEKRRTQRKRKTDVNPTPTGVVLPVNVGSYSMPPNNGSYYIQNPPKRFKVDGEILDLPPDAIIINGPIEGTKSHASDYTYNEIEVDLQNMIHVASNEIHELVSGARRTAAASIPAPVPGDATSAEVQQMFDKTFLSLSKSIYLLSQWKASWDVANAAKNRQAASVAPGYDHQTVAAVASDQAVADAVATAAAAAVANSHEIAAAVANVPTEIPTAPAMPTPATSLPGNVPTPELTPDPSVASTTTRVVSDPSASVPAPGNSDGIDPSASANALVASVLGPESVPGMPNPVANGATVGSSDSSKMIPLLMAADAKDGKEEEEATNIGATMGGVTVTEI